MKENILVAFATTHGATQEIAEFIANVLRESGLAVEVLPARSVQSLDNYSAVVLGAPFYMFKMHGDARKFLSRHRKALSELPFAFFGGGPMGKSEESEWQGVRDQVNKAMESHPWLKPVAVETVGGRYDPKKLRFPYSILPGMKFVPPSDLRDWDATRAWAAGLPALLVRHPETSGGQIDLRRPEYRP